MTINQVVESQAYVILHQQQIAQLLATRNTKAVKYIIIQKRIRVNQIQMDHTSLHCQRNMTQGILPQ
jgi:hypothetical protein